MGADFLKPLDLLRFSSMVHKLLSL